MSADDNPSSKITDRALRNGRAAIVALGHQCALYDRGFFDAGRLMSNLLFSARRAARPEQRVHNRRMWDSPNTPRLLVDHCVFTLGADTVRGVKVPQTVQWGPTLVHGWIGKLQGKRQADEWLRSEIKAIAAVTAAVRAGQIAVCTSIELTAEAMLSRLGFRGLSGDLWAGIELEDVAPPLERSRWCGALTGRKFSSREHQTAFCELLLRFAAGGVPQELLDAVRLDEFELASVAQLSEFAALCASLHRKRLCDAFHLWTAMRHGMLFLTTDKQFRSELSLDFRWRTISPTELATMLNLPAVDLPVKEGEVVDYFDPRTVRPDLARADWGI